MNSMRVTYLGLIYTYYIGDCNNEVTALPIQPLYIYTLRFHCIINIIINILAVFSDSYNGGPFS